MPGHARERSPGRWELRVYTGRDPLHPTTKRYATKTVTAAGPREADRLLAAYVTELHEAGDITAKDTFGELLEQWYKLKARGLSPAGRKETRRIIDTHLRPLARVRLDKLAGPGGTQALDEFYTELRDRGGRCRQRVDKCDRLPCPHGGGGPLSDATVHRVHVVVHAAFEQALKWELIRRNPATNATPGDIDAVEIVPPEPDDFLRLFELAQPEFGRFLALAAATGARRGELLALRWDDIDVERATINFRHVISVGADGPERVRKGRGRSNRKGGDRIVPVDPAVGAILNAQFEHDKERLTKAGVMLEPGAPTYVFAAQDRHESPATDDYGLDPWRPDSTSRRFHRLRALAGMPTTRLHDLRHLAVSELLAAGIDLRTVQEMVGHAPGSATTLRTYAHVRDPQKVAAAGVMARLLAIGPPAGAAPDTTATVLPAG